MNCRAIVDARFTRSRRGASLVELVSTMAVAGVILAGIQGSIGITLRSMPSRTGDTATTLIASRFADQLATELESAIYLSEHTATTIGFTVPDRTGDGIPERIRYAFSGTPGGPLTRQYNGAAATLIGNVNQLAFTPAYTTKTDTYPALGVEDAAESLLIDYYTGVASFNNFDVLPTAYAGQYFTLTPAADIYAWRPTRVQFMGQKNSNPATTYVQMRPATSNMTPSATVLEQYTLDAASLPTSYAWQSFSFTTLAPLAPDGAICLVLQAVVGAKSVRVENQSTNVGFLQSNNGTWQYVNNKALACQVYGKLTRSSGSQYVYNNYLTSLGVSLQIVATSPAFQKNIPCFNHPQLLAGSWELKFVQNPTTQDFNGDGAADWATHDGSAFSMASIDKGVWTTTGMQLDTAPGNNFATTTIVDLRFQNTTVGGNGAQFKINALRSGSTCAPIRATLALQADGTQTLTVSKNTSDANVVKLISVTGLAGQAVDLRLIIDPATTAVSIRVNGVEKGTFGVTRFSSSDGSQTASITASGSTATYSYARVRVLEQ